jgi:hypothetical protein
MRNGAQAAGLFVLLEESDGRQLIEKWTTELKKQWPSCVLFMLE